MKQDHAIMWEKWKDPLGYDDQEDDQDIIDPIDSNYMDNEELSIEHKHKKIKCHIITTPFGIIPFNENTASSEIFNFWTGHANFAITIDVASIIEAVDGVETLNIFTKYRFRIAVGKAFADSDVMREINKQVYNYLEN